MQLDIDEGSCIIKKVPKSTKNKYGYEDVTTKDINVLNNSKPIVVVFPGNGSVETIFANGYLTIIKNMIGLESADLYGVSYGHKANDILGQLTIREYKEFYNNIIKPLCFDKKDKPYNPDEIAKNCRKVIFFSHCAGETAVNTLVNMAAHQLKRSGFTDEQTKMALKTLAHISYTPYMENNTHYGSRVQFCSLDDKIIGKKLRAKYGINPKDEPYLGVAKILQDDNVLTVLSNSFGNVFYMNKVDDHNISTIELNENGLHELHRHSGRAMTISHSVAAILSLCVASKNFDLDLVKEVLETQYHLQSSTLFEESQKEQFYLQKKGGQPLREYMEKHNILEEDVISGKLTFDEVVKPVMKDPFGRDVYPSINYESADVKPWFNFNMPVSKDSAVISEHQIRKEDLPYIKRQVTSVVLKDGSCLSQNEEETIDDVFMHMKLIGKNLDDCVQIDLELESLDDVDKNKIEVCLGKRFRQKPYKRFSELKGEQIPSGSGGNELTEQQTRVVLNYAHRFSVPVAKIALGDGLKLNRDVMRKEIAIDERGLVYGVDLSKQQQTKERVA